jgi:hypothetical protein
LHIFSSLIPTVACGPLLSDTTKRSIISAAKKKHGHLIHGENVIAYRGWEKMKTHEKQTAALDVKCVDLCHGRNDMEKKYCTHETLLYKFILTVRTRDHLGYLGVFRQMILKCILRKQGENRAEAHFQLLHFGRLKR